MVKCFVNGGILLVNLLLKNRAGGESAPIVITSVINTDVNYNSPLTG
jgi:hypothetical protein